MDWIERHNVYVYTWFQAQMMTDHVFGSKFYKIKIVHLSYWVTLAAFIILHIFSVLQSFKSGYI